MLSKRIGIFGGSFDPPHIGHLLGAEAVRKRYKLDKIIWVPTFMPPHKQTPTASPKDRVKLVKLAIKDKPYFEISSIEIRDKKKNYTIDTLKEFRRHSAKPLLPAYRAGRHRRKDNPGKQLFLIIGADEAVEFSKWKAPAEILKLCKVIILGRPGIPACSLPHGVIAGWTKFCPLSVDISSSQIRELLQKGKSIKKLVSPEVEKYIKEKKLYKKPLGDSP